MRFIVLFAAIALVWIFGSQLIETYIPYVKEYDLWIKIAGTAGLLSASGQSLKEANRDKTQSDILDELKKSNKDK